jgi:excisionase family DNA binding protein
MASTLKDEVRRDLNSFLAQGAFARPPAATAYSTATAYSSRLRPARPDRTERVHPVLHLGQNTCASDSISSVPDASLLSVREAAERLGVGPVAVRQHIASGRLPAVKRGRSWWLDERVVQRMARQRLGGGRPLSPAMAWAVLLLASGDQAAAEEVAGRDRYSSRMRVWLRDHPLRDYAPRLRSRAEMEEFDVHPSELKRVLDRPDVLATGISAGESIGLLGPASAVEVYAPVSHRDAIVDAHALSPAAGPVRIRWVLDEVWPVLSRGDDRRAPRAAILLDLLESDEPRARREAARALA